jgi:hypothetical protein
MFALIALIRNCRKHERFDPSGKLTGSLPFCEDKNRMDGRKDDRRKAVPHISTWAALQK